MLVLQGDAIIIIIMTKQPQFEACQLGRFTGFLKSEVKPNLIGCGWSEINVEILQNTSSIDFKIKRDPV